MDDYRTQHRPGLIALRDLLLISLAVATLLWLGSVTGAFEGIYRLLRRTFRGRLDEILVACLLVAAGLALFSTRLWRSGGREAARRAEAETRFRTLVEEMPAVTYTWDPRRSFGARAPKYVSPQVEAMFGFTAAEWVANPRLWIDRIHPEDRYRVVRALDRGPRPGERLGIEYRHMKEDGGVMWVREEASVIAREASGRPRLAQSLLFDVTERLRAEEQVAEAEARYRTLVERVPAVTYIWDTSFQNDEVPATYISPQIEFLLGYSQAEFRDPTLWSRLVHNDDLERVRAEWSACRDGEVPFRSEYRMSTRDRRLVWVRDEAVRISTDDQGRPLYQGVMFDITDRKLADEKLRAAEQRYRSLVENMPVVTYISDSLNDPPQRYVAPGIEELLGYTPAEWLADTRIWSALLHPVDRARVLAEARRTEETGDPFSMEYRMLAKDGSVVWVRDEAVLMERMPETGGSVRQGVFVDITQRKEAEARLLEAEETYRTLVEQLPVVVYQDAVDDVSTALYISPQYEEMFGFPPEARLRDPDFWVDHLHPDDRDRVLAESKRTNETGDPFVVEYRFLGLNGRVVWVRDEAMLIRDSEGRPSHWQGVLMDVTQRRLAEETLASRDAVLRSVGFAAERFLKSPDWAQALPEVLERIGVAAGVSRVFVFQNQALEDGTPAMSLRARWLDEGAPPIHEPDEPLAYADGFQRWRATLSSGRELRGLTRNFPARERTMLEAEGVVSRVVVPVFVGEDWWGFLGLDDCVEAREWPPAEIEALRTAADTLGAAIGRVRAEQHWREVETRYRTLVENLPAVTYIDNVGESASKIYVSPQVETIFGYTQEEWTSADDYEEVHPEDRERVLAAIARHNELGDPFDVEYRFRTKDGRWRWVSDRASVVRDGDGRILFSQGVMSDITERKLAEEALQASERREREAAERLRALDEMKNRFLAAVSHELRSPLTSILGLSVTLEQQELPEEDRVDLTSRLAANARKLDRLLKDLLDIDRLSRGIVTPKVRQTELGELVRGTVESLDLPPERAVSIQADRVVAAVDPAKVERIVENLIVNAVRHTESDVAIWVRVWEERGGVVLAVEDEGPGVPADLQAEIFEPFRQGPTASPHSPGTGIGLSLVAMFADLHGGRAWVQDREGGGASFRVFLPAATRGRRNGRGNGRRARSTSGRSSAG